MKIRVTLKEVREKGDWPRFCELRGLNPNLPTSGGSELAEYDLSMQDAVDVGLLSGSRTPRKVMAMQLAGPLLNGCVRIQLTGFVLFRVPRYEGSGGLRDAHGSYPTLGKALEAANKRWDPGDDAEYQILDNSTGEAWAVKRMEVESSSEE